MNADPILAVALEGGERGFPKLADVAQHLRALDCTHAAPGRCVNPPPTDALRRALPPVKFPVVRNVFADMPEAPVDGHGLCADSAPLRERAVAAAVASAERALTLGARFLIVEAGDLGESTRPPGDPFDLHGRAGRSSVPPVGERYEIDAASLTDRLCRTLHAISTRHPQIGLALVTPSPGHLPTPEILEAVLEDLGPRRAHYWHDTGRARALVPHGGPPEECWLDRFAERCVGVDLCDSVAGLAGLPAGSGEVDFAAVRSALSRQVIGVVRAEPDPGPGPLLEALRVLRAAGF